ncbi:hypothetical protein J6590_026698 [Homalodisca vitripennis]|nr:hypothetical protein J6590_026698 [Homalodisca vitripennis]
MYVREVFLVFKRFAGHSKWQNIRHTKALKDTQRSLLYVKFCQRIKVAIQGLGPYLQSCHPILNYPSFLKEREQYQSTFKPPPCSSY